MGRGPRGPVISFDQNHESRVRCPCCHHKATSVPYTKEQITNVFKSHDKDGNGLLSKVEVDAAFAELGALWPAFRGWRGLKHADANHDGFVSIADELENLVDYALAQGYTIA